MATAPVLLIVLVFAVPIAAIVGFGLLAHGSSSGDGGSSYDGGSRSGGSSSSDFGGSSSSGGGARGDW